MSDSESQNKVDWEIIKRVQRGDKQAFDILVIKYQHKLAKIVLPYLHNQEDVLDVVQESFIKAYRALENFRGDSAFYTWLYRIAINTAKNFLTAQSRRPPRVDIDVTEAEYLDTGTNMQEQTTPDAALAAEQIQKGIHQAINDLPDDLKTALTLREFESMSYEEIAQIMECPVGTVRSRIFRAREAIDKQLQELL